VVKDASTGNGHGLPPTADGPDADPHALPQPTRDLTQELARLLAASIAREQAARGLAPGSMPTNSDLASLASIVSAAAGQRPLAPVFRDGLSSLSYTPQPKPEPAASEPLDHDDEPMPIPSTWREPPLGEDDRWYRQQLGAALLGLAAGLTIVVPLVLWLSGFFHSQAGKPPAPGQVAATAADAKPPEVRTVRVQPRPLEKPAEASALSVTGSIEPRTAPATVRPAPEEPAPPPVPPAARLVEPGATQPDEVLAQAARRVDGGDVTGAREVLAGADDGSQGALTFALAGTYDPNMLAAWGSRGVVADVIKARALYRKALSQGVARAQTRLDALK
jgi:hypothetical protein